jgi:hypothetical protein
MNAVPTHYDEREHPNNRPVQRDAALLVLLDEAENGKPEEADDGYTDIWIGMN